ncbi:hypothetical protein ACFVKB_49245 [Rhodococcus sp. NPDC127530]|uniref:hypothetical protein n=1 Tax=unclassified Rhodococcus (in: high G+C Gram-positive bacteria) TaxID=192944 RepID=UPI0036256CC9
MPVPLVRGGVGVVLGGPVHVLAVDFLAALGVEVAFVLTQPHRPPGRVGLGVGGGDLAAVGGDQVGEQDICAVLGFFGEDRVSPVEVGLGGGGAFGLLRAVVEQPLRDVAELVPASGHQLVDGLGIPLRLDYVDNPHKSIG